MLVVHASWTGESLRFWGEDVDAARTRRAPEHVSGDRARSGRAPDGQPTDPLDPVTHDPARLEAVVLDLDEATTDAALDEAEPETAAAEQPVATAGLDPTADPVGHPFAATADDLLAALRSLGLLNDATDAAPTEIRLRLPADRLGPLPSERATAQLALAEPDGDPVLQRFDVPALRVEPDAALDLLLHLDQHLDGESPLFGHAMRFWSAVASFVLELLGDQRFVPTLVQERSGALRAGWHPWLRDQATTARARLLRSSMPASARAVVDEAEHDPGRILEQALGALTDAAVRDLLRRESFEDAIEDRDAADPHVAWLSGLLNGQDSVPADSGDGLALMRGARSWIAQLDDTGEGRPYRLGLRLNEPWPETLDGQSEDPAAQALQAANATWWLGLHLVAPGEQGEWLDAEEVWSVPVGAGGEAGNRQELLLAELGRASRIYTPLEQSLAGSNPTGLDLSTEEAYRFLQEFRSILEEAGFRIAVPTWWDQPASRLGVRLVVDSEPLENGAGGAWNASRSDLGLHSLVDYTWQIALGSEPLTIEQFRSLADAGVPLVRIGGQWVEIREDDLEGALRFLEEHPGGRMTVLEAMRLAHGADGEASGLPINGMVATGWVSEIFGPDGPTAQLKTLDQPQLFEGTLRPYQRTGLSWLAFLDRFGLGACLADDMGLGKTIQLIALLQHERFEAAQHAPDSGAEPVGPTMLVAPMSVIANWQREVHRFAPELKVHVHHGLDRPTGERFLQIAAASDVVVTTYALVVRDLETLRRVMWRRVCLDEAQHIKNPPTKQTAAIRAMQTRHRVALTGTPVENRLSELWSIMEFLNPGYLGTVNEFRRRFAIPIERHRDQRRAAQLRELVRPFILRRLKTDPLVISDLPPLVETKHMTPMTPEQTSLYERVVGEMLARVDRAEGIQRRGLILSALVKLKQVCNHPAHLLKEHGLDGSAAVGSPPDAGRSGKAQRMMEMMEEVLAANSRALVFTQYRQMGHLLVAMLRHDLDVEPLFLHGGTPAGRRQQLIDRFQSGDPTTPIFVLSLKAGGVGLNLTAANHVFHYDRWWNPAVENQATDRAFRIGQTQTVHVHKLISAGTLEERIDQMIEQKTELAERIIGAGESWLTELSTGQLRDLFALRQATLNDDEMGEDEAA